MPLSIECIAAILVVGLRAMCNSSTVVFFRPIRSARGCPADGLKNIHTSVMTQRNLRYWNELYKGPEFLSWPGFVPV